MLPKYEDWEIVRKIGSGSFGSVYEIEKKDYGVFRAALKVITIPQSDYMVNDLRNAGMDDQSVRRYFEGEIEEIVKEFVLMSRLKGNSNIVSYEDHKIVPHEDKIAWDIYIRMELLTPLDEYFRTHAVTRQDVIRLGIDICRALEHCRKLKIIHRDIKPSNIFVSPLGNFKLGDFGISRTVERTLSTMTQGQGTPDYMAPEMYKGQSYGFSVDIYSLGIVMYRFLNQNRLPFLPPYPLPISYEDNIRARTQRLQGTPVPPPCGDDTRLSEIVQKACAYDPAERYSSPLAMRQELESIRDTEEDKKLYEINEGEPDPFTESSAEEQRDDKTYNIFFSGTDNGAGEQTEEYETGIETDDSEENMADSPETDEMDPAAGGNAAAPGSEGSKRKRILIVLILLACAVVAAAVYMGRTSTVPNVAGMEAEEAKTALKEKDISYHITSENSDKVSKGMIIRVEDAGKRVRKDSTVTLVISRGASIDMPSMLGEDSQSAITRLENLGLQVETSEEYSDQFAAGQVMAQDQEAGTILQEGALVKLTVSAGFKPFALEDYTSLSLEKANQSAGKAGLTVKIEKKYSRSVKKDHVISQSPEAGTEVRKGTEITLVVSKGVKQVKVPDVVGMSQSKAEAALKKAGLKASVSSEYSSASSGNVISQGTEKGKKVDKGSTVSITVSKGSRPSSSRHVTHSSSSSRSSSRSSSGSTTWRAPTYTPPEPEPEADATW